MSVPNPEAGLVVCYGYLWHHEHLAGHEEGRKDRPAVIVLAARKTDGDYQEVTVLPVTHRPPDEPAWAVEIPAPVKRHLGLDAGRSWVVVSEGNDFLWPGYDLRRIPGTGRYDYGFLPPRFFSRIIAAFDQLRSAGKTRLTSRE
jgi:hypothetical protein